MLTLSDAIVALLDPFVPLFDARTWRKARILAIGMVLAPRKRTVTAALRMMGLGNDGGFARYHEVLSRARWSQMAVARTLLTMLIEHLGCGDGDLVFAIDETLERRGGRRIKALGMFRDAVRSTRGHPVISGGLRWVSMMWLVHIPFANRTWALPIITALAPPEHYHRDRGRRHKTVVDWARQMICQMRRWLPHRPLVIVADGGYAVMDLYGFCQSMNRPVTLVTRMRLDASLHEPAAPRRPGQVGRPRVKGARLPRLKDMADHPATPWTMVEASWYGGKARALQITSGTALWYRPGKIPVRIRWVLIIDPQDKRDVEALACTDPDADPLQIVNWYVRRWRVEVTFQEARAHLGMETQRQWSDLAIARTTPALLGLFSWVTLTAHCLSQDRPVTPRSDAMYPKDEATFADALALVRRRLWTATGGFCTSGANPGHTKIPPRQCDRMLEFIAHAA